MKLHVVHIKKTLVLKTAYFQAKVGDMQSLMISKLWPADNCMLLLPHIVLWNGMDSDKQWL